MPETDISTHTNGCPCDSCRLAELRARPRDTNKNDLYGLAFHAARNAHDGWGHTESFENCSTQACIDAQEVLVRESLSEPEANTEPLGPEIIADLTKACEEQEANAEPLTDAELAAMQARADAASPGPWRTPEEVGDPYKAPAMMVVDVLDGVAETAPILAHEGCRRWPWKCEQDMVFAYKAREDLPACLREIQRLREQVTGLQAMVRGFVNETLRLEKRVEVLSLGGMICPRCAGPVEECNHPDGSWFGCRVCKVEFPPLETPGSLPP